MKEPDSRTRTIATTRCTCNSAATPFKVFFLSNLHQQEQKIIGVTFTMQIDDSKMTARPLSQILTGTIICLGRRNEMLCESMRKHLLPAD